MVSGLDANFSTLIRDGVSKQDCILYFPDAGLGGTWFMGQHGAFEAGGVTFREEAFSNGYLECGSTLGRTMSVNLMNPNRMLSGFSFGKCEAYISVYYTGDTPEWKITDTNGYWAEIDADHKLYYNDIGTPIDTTHNWLLLTYSSQSTTIYAYSLDGYTAEMTNGGSSITASDPWQTAALVNGLKGAITLRSTDYTYYDPDTNTAGIWLTCPMGVYNVQKPTRAQKPVIEITDAYDEMKFLDRDSSIWVVDFLTNHSSFTIYDFYHSLCSDRGITEQSASWTNSTRNRTPANFSQSSYSYRDYVYYIAEAAYGFARMTRRGGLEIAALPTTSTAVSQTLALTDIAVNSLDVQDIETLPITKLQVKWLSGRTAEFTVQAGTGSTYTIMGNPFYEYVLAQTDALKYQPTYHPLSCAVIYADPAIEVGDMVQITDANNFIGFSPKFPLTGQTITWNGKTSAVYESDGHEEVPADTQADTTAYNTYIGSLEPQVYNMTSIYGDGGTWQVMRFPNGFTIATSLQKFSVTSGQFTQWTNTYYYRTNVIHHHIPFTTVYGEYVSPYAGEESTAKSTWVAGSKRDDNVPPGDDPKEYTASYLLCRPTSVTGTMYLYYMVVGMTTNLP